MAVSVVLKIVGVSAAKESAPNRLKKRVCWIPFFPLPSLLEILRKWLPKITNSRKIRIISKNSD